MISNSLQLSLSLLLRSLRPQPTHNCPCVEVARVTSHFQRQPQRRFMGKGEINRHHANHAVCDTVQDDCLAQDLWIRAEPAAPNLVTEQNNAIAAVPFLLWQKRPPHRRVYLEHRKETRRNIGSR